MTCQGCRYYRPMKREGRLEGLCHAHPPTVLVAGGEITEARPVVHATDWACTMYRRPLSDYDRGR